MTEGEQESPPVLRTVDVGPDLAEVFLDAELRLAATFQQPVRSPALARLQVGEERYILIRAASLAHRFHELFHDVLGSLLDEGATREAAREVLYDLAHAIGRADARAILVGVEEPERRLAFGPVHFAYTGWARVRIKPESQPDAESPWLHYDHLHSFEADAFLSAGHSSELPVCLMNAGYSAGWVSESFGTRLETAEITCRARGDDSCSFVMAAPEHLEDRILEVAHQYEDTVPPAPFVLGERLLDKLAAVERERDQTQASLLEQQATLAAFFAQAPVGAFFTTQREGKILVSVANSAANEVLGKRELVGRPLTQALALLQPEPVELACKEVLEGRRGSFHDGALAYRGRDAREECVLDLHLFSIGRDQLAVLFRDRTQARRVEIAQRRAERLEATATLAGGIAHDFNNLMAGVLGHLNVLRRSELPWEETDLILSEVEGAAEHASKLSLQLVSFARRGNYESQAVHLAELVSDRLGRERTPPGVQLEFEAKSERDEVIGDPRQLQRLLLELLANALESIGSEGKVSVRLDRVEREQPEGGLPAGPFVVLEVEDDGIGIPESVQERMFEPYYSTRARGRGLGLAAADGVAKSHGGVIEVESEPGKGAILRVLIPAAGTRAFDSRTSPDRSQSGGESERRFKTTPPLPTLSASLADDLREALEAATAAEAGLASSSPELRAALERCAALTSRLQSQQLTDRREILQSLDVNELLQELAEQLRPRLEGAELEVEVDLGIGRIEGARRPLQNALSTLVFNSHEALGEEGGRIHLRGKRVEDEVWLSVEDRGTGIAPEVISRAREAFFTTKSEGGTGLGLSLAERVARAHEGRLELQSRPGGGTLAAIVLSAAEPETRPTRVLIVDDNSHVARSTGRLLELEGFEVRLAGSAAEALESFSPWVDVVLLDVILPDRSGHDVFSALRQRRPGVPIVLFSGYGEQADVSKLVALGARFLPKPFEVAELVSALREVRG